MEVFVSNEPKIDWITASTSQIREPYEVLPHAQWGALQHGILHYQCQKICSDSGSRLLWSPDTANRGSCFIASGGALDFLRRFSQVTVDRLAPRLAGFGFSATRLDCALDVYNSGFTVRDFYEGVKDGSIKVPTRTFTLISSHSGASKADTCYCGSRESERYLRVYDKGMETNSAEPGEWLRIELEIKGKRAKAGWPELLEVGENEFSRRQLLSFASMDVEFWKTLLKSEHAVPSSLLSRPIPKRRQWLLGQVSMAIKNELRDDPEFWEALRASVDAIDD